MHGYSVVLDSSEWSISPSNGNEVFTITQEDGYVLVSVSNITKDGIIEVPFSNNTYNVTIKTIVVKDERNLAEYENVVTLTRDLISTQLNSGDSFEGLYKSVVNLKYNENLIVGYEFICWSTKEEVNAYLTDVDGLVDNKEDNSIDFMILDDTTIYVVYRAIKYGVEFRTENDLRGHIVCDKFSYNSLKQDIYYGNDAQTVKAISEEYYEFTKWVILDGENYIDYSTDAEILVENVTSNMVLIAIFSGKPIEVIVKLNLPDEFVFVEGEVDFGELAFTETTLVTVQETSRLGQEITYKITSSAGEDIIFDLLATKGYSFYNIEIDPRVNYELNSAKDKFSIRSLCLSTQIYVYVKANVNNLVININSPSEKVGAKAYVGELTQAIESVEYLNNNTKLSINVRTGSVVQIDLMVFVGYKLAENEYFTLSELVTGDYALVSKVFDSIDGDLTININLIAAVYQVMFDYNYDGCEELPVVSTINYESNTFNPTLADSITNPERAKYEFIKWTTKPNGEGMSYYFEDGKIFYYTYIDGVAVKTYSFIGTGNEQACSKENIDYECTLYGNWKLITYKVELVFVPYNAANSFNISYQEVLPLIEGREIRFSDDMSGNIIGINYCPESMVLINAPAGYMGYEYYGWAYENEIVNTNLITKGNFYDKMPNNNLVVYLYYTINVDVKTSGHGSVSASSLKALYNQEITLYGVSDDAYEFSYWTKNGEIIQDSKAEMKVVVTNVATYECKFIGVKVNVNLEQSPNATLKLSSKNTNTEFRVDDYVYLEVENMKYGYPIPQWLGDHKGEVIKENSYYKYHILPEDKNGVKFKIDVQPIKIKVVLRVDKGVDGAFIDDEEKQA